MFGASADELLSNWGLRKDTPGGGGGEIPYCTRSKTFQTIALNLKREGENCGSSRTGKNGAAAGGEGTNEEGATARRGGGTGQL